MSFVSKINKLYKKSISISNDIHSSYFHRWKCSYSSIYYHHIPKTGGTTIDVTLRNWFGSKRSFPGWGWSSRLLTDAKKYHYFSGHMPWETSNLLQSPCLVFTTVRDPVKHIISYYNHYKREGLNSLALSHRAEPLLSIEDFLSDDKLYPLTNNPQCYSLGRIIDWLTFCNHLEQIQSYNWKSKKGFESSEAFLLHGTRNEDRHSHMLLECAKHRLQQPNTIAIPTEKIDHAFFMLFKLITGVKLSTIPERRNTAPMVPRYPLSDSLVAEIKSRTKLDQELYEYVCDKYTQLEMRTGS